MIKLSPSILAADRLNLGADILDMEKAGCDWHHIDVMDGHFVPNYSYGIKTVGSIKKIASKPLDVHLMIDNPELYIDLFIEQGADYLTIHAEVPGDTAALLTKIRSLGAKAGLSIKPKTTVESIRHLLPYCDMVLVMTVEPGFGGQKLMPECVLKVAELRKIGYQGLIECDGGLTADNIQQLIDAGLDVAVMGTALYASSNRAEDIRRYHEMKKHD